VVWDIPIKPHLCIWNVSTQPQHHPFICNANRVAAAKPAQPDAASQARQLLRDRVMATCRAATDP